MITDVILLIDDDTYWFAQADGDMFSWYKAQAEGLSKNCRSECLSTTQAKINGTFRYFD